MAGIGEASAIIGVAQIGIQFAQILVTVIGDYRDAATNINRLRDEVHLTSIALQQLGDLAARQLLRSYGILESTNLASRCRAVFWEIRTTIRNSDTPLHPAETTKEQIDVSFFTAWKWALWTKSKLEGPRDELDRLKDSMTLTFVSHMALLAATDFERQRYASQIPGIRRSIQWSEDNNPSDDELRNRLKAAGVPDEKIADILGDTLEPTAGPPVKSIVTDPPIQSTDESPEVILRAWSIDPLARTIDVPLQKSWLKQYVLEANQGDVKMWDLFERLHPWFKNEINVIFEDLKKDENRIWCAVLIKPSHKHFWKGKTPNSVQLVMKGERRQPAAVPTTTYAMEYNTTLNPITYAATEEVISLPVEQESDAEIIAKQLALYE